VNSDSVLRMHLTSLILIVVTLSFYRVEGKIEIMYDLQRCFIVALEVKSISSADAPRVVFCGNPFPLHSYFA
jgi:hypothetical protein